MMKLRRLLSRLCLWALAPALWVAPSLAHAVDFCGLLAPDTMPAISTLLEGQGCSLDQDSGVDLRSFDCPGKAWFRIDTSRYGMRALVASFRSLEGFDEGGGFTCAGYSRTETQTLDNPFVLSVAEFSKPGQGRVRIAVVGFPGMPLFITACVGYSCESRVEEDLKSLLKIVFQSDWLRYEASDIRIAGLDLTRTSRDDLVKGLVDRGGRLVEAGDTDSLLSFDSLLDVEGVPGLKRVEIRSLAGRPAMVFYNIPAEADYVAFSKSLDDRYGASTRSMDDGCVSRLWRNGGVVVLGDFCRAKPEKSGFSFMNEGATDIASGYIRASKEWSKSTDDAKPTPPKPKSDMF